MGDKTYPASYRPIAITSLLSKVMERIINVKMHIILKYSVADNIVFVTADLLGILWYILRIIGLKLLKIRTML